MHLAILCADSTTPLPSADLISSPPSFSAPQNLKRASRSRRVGKHVPICRPARWYSLGWPTWSVGLGLSTSRDALSRLLPLARSLPPSLPPCFLPSVVHSLASSLPRSLIPPGQATPAVRCHMLSRLNSPFVDRRLSIIVSEEPSAKSERVLTTDGGCTGRLTQHDA